jgi:hypothetical protein
MKSIIRFVQFKTSNFCLERHEIFLSGLLMFLNPNIRSSPGYIAYLIECFHFVVTKHDSSTRKNEVVVQSLSQPSCLHDSFLLTKSLKNKSLLDGVVYTR